MVLPVYAPTFLLSLGQGLLIPTLPFFAGGFGVTDSLIGLAVAASALGTLAADVPVGIALSRLGRRRAMLVGIMLVATATLLIPLIGNYPVMVLCRLVGGVGTALWGISRHAYITDVAPRAQRGKFLATFGGVNRIGVFGGPFVGGVLGERFGLGIPFYLTAALAAVAGVMAVMFIKETGNRGVVPAHAGLRWRSVGTLMRTHRVDLASAGAAQIFVQMIRSGRQLIIPLYGRSIGLDVGEVGIIVTVAALVDMTLFIPAGLVMDRFGRKWATVPSFTVMGLGMALIPLASGFGGLLLAASVIGFGNGMGSGSMMTLGADLAPPNAVGEFLGIWRFIGDAGGAGGPLVVGIVADAFGLISTAFTLAGVGFLAAGILSWLVRETLEGETPPPNESG